jgi:hypothetical protein
MKCFERNNLFTAKIRDKYKKEQVMRLNPNNLLFQKDSRKKAYHIHNIYRPLNIDMGIVFKMLPEQNTLSVMNKNLSFYSNRTTAQKNGVKNLKSQVVTDRIFQRLSSVNIKKILELYQIHSFKKVLSGAGLSYTIKKVLSGTGHDRTIKFTDYIYRFREFQGTGISTTLVSRRFNTVNQTLNTNNGTYMQRQETENILKVNTGTTHLLNFYKTTERNICEVRRVDMQYEAYDDLKFDKRKSNNRVVQGSLTGGVPEQQLFNRNIELRRDNVDMDKLADKVYVEIERRLKRERERKGLLL